MYDNLCKFLAEEYPADFATWLLGQPIPLTILSPKELSHEPVRADSLIVQSSGNLVLHVEFQREPDLEIPFRMLDYYVRIYRRFPDKEIRQVVVYLKKTSSPLVQIDNFTTKNGGHNFEVIRLWEQPTELFLDKPGLLPLAILSKTENRTQVLTQVSQKIEEIDDRRVRANIAAASAVLAGLVLEKQLIRTILRRDIMRESAIYQEILAEGFEEGRQEGLQEGRQEGLQEGHQLAMEEVAVNLLRGGMTSEQVAGVTGLSIEWMRSKLEEMNDDSVSEEESN